jgi:hypothetical protein
MLQSIINLIPEEWLVGESTFKSVTAHRGAYLAYLLSRLEASAIFVEEANRARAQLV